MPLHHPTYRPDQLTPGDQQVCIPNTVIAVTYGLAATCEIAPSSTVEHGPASINVANLAHDSTNSHLLPRRM